MRPRLTRAVLAALAFLVGSPSTSRAEVDHVRIGLQHTLLYLPLLVAQSEGLFDKSAKAEGLKGLTVALSFFSGATAMNEALLSNNVDIGSVGLGGALIAWDKTPGRQHVKMLAVVSRCNLALFSNDPNIKTLADFSLTKKIAVPAFNSLQAMMLREAARKMLGDASKADSLLVSLPQPDATTTLIAGTAIAGFFASPPFIQVLEKQPHIHTVLYASDILEGKNVTTLVEIAQQGFVDDNPKVARAIVNGLRQADEFIAHDPKRAAAIYLETQKLGMTSRDVEHVITDGSVKFWDKPEGVKLFARIMFEQKMLTKQPQHLSEVFFDVANSGAEEK